MDQSGTRGSKPSPPAGSRAPGRQGARACFGVVRPDRGQGLAQRLGGGIILAHHILRQPVLGCAEACNVGELRRGDLANLPHEAVAFMHCAAMAMG